ncbi:MAG TPA: LEA type 2 family protein [Burkholderiales bacterium]|nr:LEA type 2 family protein [Burkholderiales bacterium]
MSDPKEARRSAWGAVLAGLLVLALPGSRLFGRSPVPAAKETITLSLRDKVIRDLSSSGLTLAFRIGVTNRSASDRELVRYRYRVVINQREFLNMTVGLAPPLSVPAGRETLIDLPVKITYGLLFEAVGPIEVGGECDVAGEMVFADERRREEKVSFAYPGDFPVFKDPEVEFLPLKVNDLTPGGADVVLRARFRNLNPYELVVSRISYRLLVGDKEVQAGLVPGDKSLPKTGEKVFSFPLVLDFFEVGPETRTLFEKPPVPCRLAGEIEITSAWGTLVVRFDKSQALSVEK